MKTLNYNIMKADVISDSGYMYPKDVMKKAIDNFNAKYDSDNQCLCDNESLPNINLEKVSHSISNMAMDEDGVISADFKILGTPQGKILQDVIDINVEFKAFSNGIATIDVLEDVNTVSDYRFISVSLKPIGI